MPTTPNHLSRAGILMMAVLLMAVHVQSLHLHTSAVQEPKEYNEDAYLQSLAGLQERLNNDVKAIQQKFTAINMRLSDTNISDSEKLIFLQENLANERDSLFNVQTYLNEPFALRSCQCLNVTQKQKEDLQAQILDVQASINALEAALNGDGSGNSYQNPKCPDGKCAVVQSIKSQIAQMRNYVKIMSDTATSECCKIVNYVYRDNLQTGNNWVYGSTNEKDYRLSIFNKSLETKDANLTQCPADRPMANLTSNQCFACPPNNPLFNLGNRSCQPSCESQSLIFVAATHQCDYNRNCNEGDYFNNNTHKCEKDLGTDSTCPKDRPVWSPKTLTCNKCDNSTPYFDLNFKSCRKCTENEVWQEYTEECLDKSTIVAQCKTGQYYDKQSKSCFNIPTTKPTGPGSKVGQGTTPVNPNKGQGGNNPSGGPSPTQGTYSQCPPATPFWSTSDLACYKCPDTTPSYNSNTNKCEQCPDNTTWSAATGRCEKQPSQCPTGQAFDTTTQRCEIIVNCESNQVYNSATGKCDTFSPTGQIGMCPPESPFWNSKTLYCQKCSQSTPLWNKTAKECQSCPNNTAWDSNKETCKSTLKQCPPGQALNLTTNNCVVVKCSNSTPIFNYATSKCQPCPDGTRFNNSTSICESLSPQRTNTSVCPADAPYWNPQQLFCDVCPSGQTLDSSKKCQPIASHFIATQSHKIEQATHNLPQKVHAEIQKNRILHLSRLRIQDHLQV